MGSHVERKTEEDVVMTRRVPVLGESSMCMMCFKYRIILLIVIKNPWVILLTYFLLRGD